MDKITVADIARESKTAFLKLGHLSTAVKNQALEAMAETLEGRESEILEANKKDLEFARRENLPQALVARLALDGNKVRGMAKGVRSVARLPDPVDQQRLVMEMDKDLTLYQVACPIGVIGAIFESRPDAVPQISSLCLKSGNAVILKGGTEAQNSNKTLVALLTEAIGRVPGVPQTAIQMIETRAEVLDMLREERHINLIVPRGSNAFVKHIQDNTKIPVLGHSEGICHGYIHSRAEPELAVKVALDSKIQYPAACNAMENLLIHQDVADLLLPRLAERFKEHHVELVGCGEVHRRIPDIPQAHEAEWDREYNDLKLAVKIVANDTEAIDFINTHGSGHTDVILTQDRAAAERFLNEVDSASVMWNASTRFADGFRYGLGAEIGISTNKTHARGPVGLEGLVIYKYKVIGNGQIVAEYTGENAREFTHRPLVPLPRGGD